MTIPLQAQSAALALIHSLQCRPQWHSVRIETGVDGTGAFTHTLVCSIHPDARGVEARVPTEMGGYPVRSEPWPTSTQ